MKYLIILMLLAGCTQANDYQLMQYQCSPAQLIMVEYEFTTCNKSTFSSAFCFAQAKRTHCNKEQ